MRLAVFSALLLAAAPAFAGGPPQRSAVAMNTLGVRALYEAYTLEAPGDDTEVEVIVPGKLAAFGLRGLTPGDVVKVLLLEQDVIEVSYGEQTVELEVDANGRVRNLP